MKKEYIVLAIVVLCLSLYLALRNPDKSNYKLPAVPQVSGKDITKIEVLKSGNLITLNKKADNWYIQPKGYIADKQKIESMLNIIGTLNLTALISESKNYSRYDLDDQKKVVVKAWAGEVIKREIEVGKAASSYQHTFIKIKGDDKVYHARESFRDKFDQTLDEYREKLILSFKKDEIKDVNLTKDGKSISFTKKDITLNNQEESKAGTTEKKDNKKPKTEQKWLGADGKQADMNSLLSDISELRCEKFLDNSKKEDFKNPIFTISLKGNRNYALSVYPKIDKNAKEYPSFSSESEYVFFLPDWKVEDIMKKYDEFIISDSKPTKK